MFCSCHPSPLVIIITTLRRIDCTLSSFADFCFNHDDVEIKATNNHVTYTLHFSTRISLPPPSRLYPSSHHSPLHSFTSSSFPFFISVALTSFSPLKPLPALFLTLFLALFLSCTFPFSHFSFLTLFLSHSDTTIKAHDPHVPYASGPYQQWGQRLREWDRRREGVQRKEGLKGLRPLSPASSLSSFSLESLLISVSSHCSLLFPFLSSSPLLFFSRLSLSPSSPFSIYL